MAAIPPTTDSDPVPAAALVTGRRLPVGDETGLTAVPTEVGFAAPATEVVVSGVTTGSEVLLVRAIVLTRGSEVLAFAGTGNVVFGPWPAIYPEYTMPSFEQEASPASADD